MKVFNNLAALVLASTLGLVATVCAAQPGLAMNAAAQALFDAAQLLSAQGKSQEALAKYSAAAAADPSSSVPLSHIAELFRSASEQAQGEQQARLRQQAESLVRQILQKYPDEPLAHEVLRKLNDNQPPPLHTPTPAALEQMNLGEMAFTRQQFDVARSHYARAAALDPQYSMAWIYAGDCDYAQKKYAEAEASYRKGVDIEPLNAQGWRYLSDALAYQNKRGAAEQALLNGIAAQPSQVPSWIKLAQLRAAAGYPLTSLNLVRKASASLDAEGKATVHLDPAFSGSDPAQPADGALWLAIGVQHSTDLRRERDGQGSAGAFAAELARWRAALAMVDEVVGKGGADLAAPPLKTLHMLYQDGELETALLLLQYREAWRADFEAWKQAHPQGIRKFIDKYGLRP